MRIREAELLGSHTIAWFRPCPEPYGRGIPARPIKHEKASDDMSDVEKAFAYETWASRRILARLRQIPDPEPELLRLFSHTLIALKVWGTRIRGQDSSHLAIWPDLSLDDCERLLGENDQAFGEMLSNPRPDLLETVISYTNQHGLSYATKVRDILFHLVTHGGYHRGQLARRLREGGHEPVNTAYITYVRELAGAPGKP